ncbi:cytochrome P450 4V2-like [Dermacentor silvarum]|uniref:cytochrome P450 4V2-like n=1 Tax=Dermacentor silvarum TaxID=543639 RepID=UPI0021015865|nr:cytochrome P450 4V2-like [Dermacentor silvarum]
MSAMGPNVDVKFKAFRYLQDFFKSLEDQDVTVGFCGPYPVLLGSTPQVGEAILGYTKNTTRAFFYNTLKPWMVEGIVTLNDEPWRARRKAMTPSFHYRILDDHTPIMDKREERLVQKLASIGARSTSTSSLSFAQRPSEYSLVSRVRECVSMSEEYLSDAFLSVPFKAMSIDIKYLYYSIPHLALLLVIEEAIFSLRRSVPKHLTVNLYEA